MSLVATTTENSEAQHRLFDELSYALQRTSANDLKSWGKKSALRFPKVGARRLRNVGKLAFRLAKFLGCEAILASSAWKQNRLGRHLALRAEKGIGDTIETGLKAYQVISAVAAALRNEPKKNAAGVLSFALGFFVGSGGLDGNGGLPDTDIALFGIGDHRSILTHSVIMGMVAECSILALADLAGIVCDKLPKEKRSPFWEFLSASRDQIAKQLSIGASSGIAYHLAVDATIQPAAYKDLPVALPIEAHQSVFALNAIVEGSDGLHRSNNTKS